MCQDNNLCNNARAYHKYDSRVCSLNIIVPDAAKIKYMYMDALSKYDSCGFFIGKVFCPEICEL